MMISPNHVRACFDKGAIDCLLVTDSLFRSSDIATRKSYVFLVDGVRAQGGNVYIFSSLHVSGQRMLCVLRQMIIRTCSS